MNLILSIRLAGDDLEIIRIAPFHHDLAAYTARGAEFFCLSVLTAYNSNGIKLLYPFADRLEEGRALGTVGRGQSGIFNVAAGIDFTVFSQQSSADGKMRIRNVFS